MAEASVLKVEDIKQVCFFSGAISNLIVPLFSKTVGTTIVPYAAEFKNGWYKLADNKENAEMIAVLREKAKGNPRFAEVDVLKSKREAAAAESEKMGLQKRVAELEAQLVNSPTGAGNKVKVVSGAKGTNKK